MVSPAAARLVVLLQDTLARPAHEPDNNCMRELMKLAPNELKVIVGLDVNAVKEYHTSYTGAPQAGAGMPADKVAPTILPCILVQVVPEVNVTAPAQSSFTGAGSVTQILNIPATFGLVYTLIR